MADLVTERLVLHLLDVAEAQRVAARRPDPGDRWEPGYPEAGDVSGAVRFLAAHADTGDPGRFGVYEIRRRADGRTIGGIGFHGVPDEDLSVTVGYGLVAAARGQGYASEALRELLRLARSSGVATVRGDANLDNVASQRVMAAAGMRLMAEDGQLRYYRIDYRVDDRADYPG